MGIIIVSAIGLVTVIALIINLRKPRSKRGWGKRD